MRTESRSLLLLVLSIGLAACGGDKDKDGGGGIDGGVDIHSISFTESNVEVCASIAAAVLAPFPSMGHAVIAVADAVAERSGSAPAAGPQGTIDLGDIGICPSGQSNLKWNDADADGELSPGDRTVLTLTDCDGGRSGTLTLDFQEASFASTEADVALSIQISETVDGEAEYGTLTGQFHLLMNRYQGPPETAVIRFKVNDNASAAQGMMGTLNGKTEFELGCFDFYFTLAVESGYFTLSEPFGVLKIPDLGIASFESFGLPALTFPEGTYPQSGAMKLMAFSAVTPCAGVKVPGDGINGNDSHFTLTATGGGSVTLAGTDAAGEAFSVVRAWSELD